MSLDDVTAYMAKREKSTLTAPNPEGSPSHIGLLNPSNHPANNLGVGLTRISPPTSAPTTPQHYFHKATPQGSLSHMPPIVNHGGHSSGAVGPALTSLSSANPSPHVGNSAAAPAARGESPSSTHNTPSSQLRHISDVAKMVARKQHAAYADPTSVANTCNQLSANAFDATIGPLSVRQRKEFNFETGDTGLINFLCSVPHLYMISNADIRELSRCLLRREFNLHDTILVNKQSVNHVYIVLKGRVEAYSVSQLQWDPRSQRPEDMVTHHERIGTIEVANMFCIDSVVFSEPSEFMYCAGDERTLLGLIPAQLFLSILNRNVAMRQSIGRKIADHMDIFICFKDFCRHIYSHETAKHEYLPLWQILHAYERLDNCIHTKRASQEIDVDAWNYAIKRLPENLTFTFVFDLVRALPPFLTTRMKDLAKAGAPAAAIGDVRYIVTKERRRCSWQLGMEGKTLVLLRDGFTDLLDFITCLCIHIIESNKLRGRLQGMVSPPAVDILDAKLSDIAKREEAARIAAAAATMCGFPTDTPSSTTNGADTNNITNAVSNASIIAANAAAVGIEGRDIREVLSKMPLSERERYGLHRNWGDTCLRNIYAVLMHREEYLLRVDVSASRQFMTDPFHEWSLNLRKKLMLAMKLNPQGHLPEDLIIDIISSNTHSTKSLLSSFPRLHRDKILAHAKEKKPELFNLPWALQEDLVYANCRNYTDATGTGKEFNECLKRAGFEILEDTAMTGMQVDIVPVGMLDMSLVDPLLATRNCVASGPRHFILNMDFAFGAQADGITATLVDTFGKYIRSFNVMGKAGGIASSMRRGDIQLASHVLLSKSSLTTEDFLDELRSCGNLDLTTDFVQTLCGQHSKIQVFNGPVLTIPGTMLQNDKLLLYYRHIWHCVGVEMEGSYFARQIKENLKAKLLNETIQTRFAYYTSDMPLHSLQGDASLSTPMRPNEGTPPLYAVARALLIRILSGTDLPQKPELAEVCGPSESIRAQIAADAIAAASNPFGISLSGSPFIDLQSQQPPSQRVPMPMQYGGGGAFTLNNRSATVAANASVSSGTAGGGGGGGLNNSTQYSTQPLMRDMSVNFNRMTATNLLNHNAAMQRNQGGAVDDSHSSHSACGKLQHTHSGASPPPDPTEVTRANSIVGIPHAISSQTVDDGESGSANSPHLYAKLPASAASAASATVTSNTVREVGSNVSKGAANGRPVYEGPRGGTFYVEPSGKQRYLTDDQKKKMVPINANEAGNAGGEICINNDEGLNQQFSPTSYPHKGNTFTTPIKDNNNTTNTTTTNDQEKGFFTVVIDKDNVSHSVRVVSPEAIEISHSVSPSPFRNGTTKEVAAQQDTYSEGDDGNTPNKKNNKTTNNNVVSVIQDLNPEVLQEGDAAEDDDEEDAGDKFNEGIEDEDVDGYEQYNTTTVPPSARDSKRNSSAAFYSGARAGNNNSRVAVSSIDANNKNNKDNNSSFSLSPLLAEEVTSINGTPTPSSSTQAKIQRSQEDQVAASQQKGSEPKLEFVTKPNEEGGKKDNVSSRVAIVLTSPMSIQLSDSTPGDSVDQEEEEENKDQPSAVTNSTTAQSTTTTTTTVKNEVPTKTTAPTQKSPAKKGKK